MLGYVNRSRLASDNSEACASHDQTVFRPFVNRQRPTHVTGSTQCPPWPAAFS
jgi:hypothetical protein